MSMSRPVTTLCLILALLLTCTPAWSAVIEGVRADAANEQPGLAAANLVDGDLSTAWAGGGKGVGPGKWIELTFPGPVRVEGLSVATGNQAKGRFDAYRRLTRGVIIFPDETRVKFTLEPAQGEQRVALEPKVAQSIRIIITGVDPAARDASLSDDAKVAVSEIRVLGTPESVSVADADAETGASPAAPPAKAKQPEPKPEPAPKAEVKPAPAPKPETKPEPEPAPAPAPKPEPKPEPRAEVKPEVKPVPEKKAAPKVEAKPAPEPKAKPEAKPESEVKAKPQPEPAPKAEPAPAPKAAPAPEKAAAGKKAKPEQKPVAQKSAPKKSVPKKAAPATVSAPAGGAAARLRPAKEISSNAPLAMGQISPWLDLELVAQIKRYLGLLTTLHDSYPDLFAPAVRERERSAFLKLQDEMRAQGSFADHHIAMLEHIGLSFDRPVEESGRVTVRVHGPYRWYVGDKAWESIVDADIILIQEQGKWLILDVRDY